MALSVDHTENGKDESQADFADIPVSHSFALGNASGNDRLVVFLDIARSGQVGNLTVGSAATLNGTSATGSATFNESGTQARNLIYAAWWKDSDLPATAGSYTIAFTSSNSGASPFAAWAAVELTGVDQTTPKSEAEDTAQDFGITQQVYTPSTGGDFIMGVMSMDDTGGSDPTATMTDTTIAYHSDSGSADYGAVFGYAVDGALACTAGADYPQESWFAIAFTAAAGGGATGKANPLSGPLGGPLSGPLG